MILRERVGGEGRLKCSALGIGRRLLVLAEMGGFGAGLLAELR
jgi:hypothetical protein